MSRNYAESTVLLIFLSDIGILIKG